MQGIYSGKWRVFRAGTIGVICPRIGKWVLRGFGMAEHHRCTAELVVDVTVDVG